MREIVEVHSNPRGKTDCKVALSAAQVKAGLSYKPKKKKTTALAVVSTKKKKSYKRKPKNDEGWMVAGAAVAGAIEILIFRNNEWSERIPWQLRRYSGVAMAALGGFMGRMKGVKADMRAFYKGFMAGGAYLAVSDEIYRTRKDNTISEAKKIMEEALAKVQGMGYMPSGPRMTAGQAMAELGAQTRIPFHPHDMGNASVWGGMGEFDYSDNPGMGEFVNLPAGAVTDPSLDMRLDPAGLGELGEFVDSDDANMWAEGQIAFAQDDQNDIWGNY